MKFAVLACVLAAGAARAADPVASGLPAGYSFAKYSGAAAVGEGLVDASSEAFFIDEGPSPASRAGTSSSIPPKCRR